jgi:hypothetical protein
MKEEFFLVFAILVLSLPSGCYDDEEGFFSGTEKKWITSGNLTVYISIPEEDMNIGGTFNVTVTLRNNGTGPVKLVPMSYHFIYGSVNFKDEDGEPVEFLIDYCCPSPPSKDDLIVLEPGQETNRVIGITNEYYRFMEGKDYTVQGRYYNHDSILDVPELWKGSVMSEPASFHVKVDENETSHLLHMVEGYEAAKRYIDFFSDDPFLVEARSEYDRRLNGFGEDWSYSFHIPSTLKNDSDPDVEDGYWSIERVTVTVWRYCGELICSKTSDEWLTSSMELIDPDNALNLSVNSLEVAELLSDSTDMERFRNNYSDVWVKYILSPVEWFVQVSSHEHSPQLRDGAIVEMRYKPWFDHVSIRYDDLSDSA